MVQETEAGPLPGPGFPHWWRGTRGPHHPFCGLECLPDGPQLVPRFAHQPQSKAAQPKEV